MVNNLHVQQEGPAKLVMNDLHREALCKQEDNAVDLNLHMWENALEIS